MVGCGLLRRHGPAGPVAAVRGRASPTSLHNLLVVKPDQPLSDRLDALQFVGAVLVDRARASRSRPALARRDAAAAARAGAGAVDGRRRRSPCSLVARASTPRGAPQSRLELVAQALLATVPFAFLAGLLRSRLAQASGGRRAGRRLGQAPAPRRCATRWPTRSATRRSRSPTGCPSPSASSTPAGGRSSCPTGGWTEVEHAGRADRRDRPRPVAGRRAAARARGRRRGRAGAREPAADGRAARAHRGAARLARPHRRGRPTPSAAGSSATCTTARRRGSSRWR